MPLKPSLGGMITLSLPVTSTYVDAKWILIASIDLLITILFYFFIIIIVVVIAALDVLRGLVVVRVDDF